MLARVRGAIVVLAAVIVSPLALAQPSDDTDETSKPDKQADKAEPAGDKVEAKQPASAPAPADPPVDQVDTPGDRDFSWEPFGYLRLQYRAVQNDPSVEYVGRNDGFELQNARVGVRGALTRDGERVAGFVLSFDGAVDEREQINTTTGKLRVGLRDAFVDLVLAGKVAARAGFFHSLLDPESLVSDTKRTFVDKPLESRGVRATEGYQTQPLTPDRSIGAAIRLDPGWPNSQPVGFELAVQNGADEYASNNDNDYPAVSAALLARFVEDGWVVAGIRYNRRTVGELPMLQDEDDLQASGGVNFAAGPVELGAGAVFVRTSFPTTDGPTQNAFGAHAQLVIAAGERFAVGYRFGILDPSSLITTDRVMEHTAGGVVGVPRLRMRLQFQITHVVEQRSLSNSRAQIAAEVSL